MGYSIRRFAGALAVAGLLLSAVIYFINGHATDVLTRAEAKNTSTKWTQQLLAQVPDLDKIVSGDKPSAAAMSYFHFVAGSPAVESFRLFSLDGSLVLDSGHLDEMPLLPLHQVDLKEHNPEVFEAMSSGSPFAIVEHEHVDGEPEIMAEAYLPVMHDGHRVGIASVYTNQTELAEALKDQFTLISLIIAAVSAIGFAIPSFAAIRQMDKLRKANVRIQYLARHDVLTGLPNRMNCEEQFEAELLRCRTLNAPAAIHYIDVDYFKEINDRHGHAVGDKVLRAFAARLRDVLGEKGVASRFGGDEFVVLQSGFTLTEELMKAIEGLVAALDRPFEINGTTMIVTSSIGTALYPVDGATTLELLANADTALYVVKTGGRNGQSFFNAELRERKNQRSEIEELVRAHAAARNFELHFQPLYHLKSKRLKGFEALLRMRGRDGAYVSPTDFIPVAEDIGLIDEIGSWVLQEACRYAVAWPRHLQVSVNLSAVQFRRKSVIPAVEKALAASGLPAQQLLLEVTESLLMTDIEGVLEQLATLKQLGITLAMDDFGTGFSSLSYMMRFPFDRIKIDRSFVTQLNANDEKAQKVVQSIVALSHTMDMSVTAEGVETQSQAETLQAMKCDDVQGFLYSKSVPASEVAALLLQDFMDHEDQDAGDNADETAVTEEAGERRALHSA